MKRHRLLPLLVFALAVIGVAAFAQESDPDLDALFQRNGVRGTLILSTLNGEMRFVHNPQRAEEVFVPASTFKIPNTLIALAEGVIRDEQAVLAWNGYRHEISGWNADQTLKTAFATSCVWFYQELAKRIGRGKYRGYLELFGYGNRNPGPELTRFWLDGDLRISAANQIEFLQRLYRGEFPLRPEHYDILRDIMVVEQTPHYTLRAKTGWAASVSPQVGWYVGYLEAGSTVWFFALNMEIESVDQLPLRRDLVMQALQAKDLL